MLRYTSQHYTYQNIPVNEQCECCGGTGLEEHENYTDFCQYCNGTGIATNKKMRRFTMWASIAILFGGHAVLLWVALK